MYYVLSIKYKIFKICLILAFSIHVAYYMLHTTALASAQTMSNQSYILQTQAINPVSNTTTNNEKPVPKVDPSVFEGVNYKVKTGFDALTNINPFSVSLSSNLVDFGILSPTNPVIRTVDLNTQGSAAYGYSVILFENKPLSVIPSAGKDFIPDTTCDNGACDTESSAEWINALTYGLGYRCDNLIGLDCDSSFIKTNFYKHFPDIAGNDDPQSIMAGNSSNKGARISYRVNIPGNQAKGIYNNIITYIAVPNF